MPRTTLLCSERPDSKQPELSIVHGAIDLEQLGPDYGAGPPAPADLDDAGSAVLERLPRLQDSQRRERGLAATVRSSLATQFVVAAAGWGERSEMYVFDDQTRTVLRRSKGEGDAGRWEISVYKRRGGAHEATVRELRFGRDGIRIGEPLREFQGVLTGTPRFTREASPSIEEADAF